MKKFFKENIRNIIFSFWSLLNALMFLAMRVNYAGISKALGADKLKFSETVHPTTFKAFIVMDLPIVVCILMFLTLIFSLIVLFVFKNKKKAPWIITLSLNILFTIAIIVIIILGSFDYLGFILPKFINSLIVSLLIIGFALLLFFPIVGNTKRAIITKSSILGIVIILSVILGYKLRFNYFTYDAVVYAVEDDYQIVFSTSDNSVAWVTVGDKTYYDTYAGSMKSKDLVHKISVPQSELDTVKSYSINAEQLNYRGPFGAFYGKKISKTHTFKPVDTSDGIQYYAISDVHESYKGVINAIKNADEFDFLVSVGDLSSDVEGEYYANYTNKIMSKALNGEKPVVYARGNHECKGTYSEDLYKYVGSLNQNFYYTFELAGGAIKGLVLDIGEDHDRNASTNETEWWEYYGTDQFDSYRDEQTKFINNHLLEFSSSTSYNMVVCHIPIVFVNNREDHKELKELWTSKLNLMNIDIGLWGHQHELVPYTTDQAGLGKNGVGLTYNVNWKDSEGNAGKNYSKGKKEYLTDYTFTSFMVGRGSDDQLTATEKIGTSKYTGLYVNVEIQTLSYKQTATYMNSKGSIVPTMKMWVDSEAINSWEFTTGKTVLNN